MPVPKRLPDLLFWPGLALLAGAAALLAAARLLPAEGLQDLARVAGAILLAALAALAMGLYLLVSRRAPARQPRWRLVAASLACAVGILASFGLLQVAAPSGNAGLVVFALLAGILAAWALAGVPPLWRRA